MATNAQDKSEGEVREGFVPVPGGRVWYRIVGADRTGIPLLALHGGPGVTHDYLEPLEELADERPVAFYDQLGSGRSDHPADPALWTLERFVEELDLVRRALGLGQVHLLGQSWGSMLAVEYLLTRRPEGVRGLVLSGPCLSASRWAADQRAYMAQMPPEVRRVLAEAEAAKDFSSPRAQEAMMAYYRRHVCRLDPWPDCLQRSFSRLNMAVYGKMWGPSEFTVTGTLKDFERAERLGELRVPALFTAGRYDEATPAAAEHYRSRLPGARLAVFEEASHSHHVEKREEYLGTVRAFLREASAAAPAQGLR